jgi:hypothetical protein
MTTPVWTDYRTSSCVVPVPSGWTAIDGSRFELEAVVIAPSSGQGFDPNLVVATIDLPAPADPDGWLDTADLVLDEELPGFRVVRRGSDRVDGHDAVRRLARYEDPRVGPVAMEQWVVATGRGALVLTASTAGAEYDPTAAVFAEMISGVRLIDGDRAPV